MRKFDKAIQVLEDLGVEEFSILGVLRAESEFWELRYSGRDIDLSTEYQVENYLNAIVQQYQNLPQDSLNIEDLLPDFTEEQMLELDKANEAKTKKSSNSNVLKLLETLKSLGCLDCQVTYYRCIGLEETSVFFLETENENFDTIDSCVDFLEHLITVYKKVHVNLRKACIKRSFDPGYLIDLTLEDQKCFYQKISTESNHYLLKSYAKKLMRSYDEQSDLQLPYLLKGDY